jgi:transcription antitermination factor NusG
MAAAFLTRADLEIYLPMVSVVREASRSPSLQPFFPGYLFGHLDAERAELGVARRTPGVLYLLGYGDEPWPVPEALIETIQRRLLPKTSRMIAPSFRPGDRVLITSGPFRGLEAVFDQQLSPSGRVRVLIQVLQRLCRAELHTTQLRATG